MTNGNSLLKPKCLVRAFNAKVIVSLPGVVQEVELDQEQVADLINKLYDAKFEAAKMELN